MRTLGNRRAFLGASVMAVAAVALAGCSAGQVAETSLKRPSNQGVNADNSNKTVAVRNLAVSYNGTTGYPAGANAPLEGGIFNLTTQEVTVLVSSTPPPAGAAYQQVVNATSVGLVGGSASPGGASPAGSSEPSAAPSAVQPARIVLAPLASVSFLPGDQQSLQAIGLTKALSAAGAVNLTFEFSNGAQPLTVPAPVAPPLSPAPRESGIPNENVETD